MEVGAAAPLGEKHLHVGTLWLSRGAGALSSDAGAQPRSGRCYLLWLGRRPSATCSRVGRMATEVRAHITGTVWKILVKPGDEVTAEQTLVILESMKMEMPVEAPEAGRVASVAVVEGASVDEGDLLLSLESA